MAKFIFSLLLLFFVFGSNQAYACASCGFNDGSNAYFLKMILFMTALPVICVGSAVYYVRKKSIKKLNTEGLAHVADDR